MSTLWMKWTSCCVGLHTCTLRVGAVSVLSRQTVMHYRVRVIIIRHWTAAECLRMLSHRWACAMIHTRSGYALFVLRRPLTCMCGINLLIDCTSLIQTSHTCMPDHHFDRYHFHHSFTRMQNPHFHMPISFSLHVPRVSSQVIGQFLWEKRCARENSVFFQVLVFVSHGRLIRSTTCQILNVRLPLW